MKLIFPRATPQLLLAGVFALLLACGTYANVADQRILANIDASTAAQQDEATKASLAPVKQSSQSTDISQDPVTSNVQSGSVANIQISANVPRSTFPAGEDSGIIMLTTNTSTTLHWSIIPQYPSPIYVADQSSYISASTMFRVKSNPPPTKSGTFTVSIEVRKPKSDKVLGSKTLHFTVTHVDPFVLDMPNNVDIIIGESAGGTSACMPYTIDLAYDVFIHDVKFKFEEISGDFNGINSEVYTGSREGCFHLGIGPQVMPGSRTYRITASLFGYSQSIESTANLVY